MAGAKPILHLPALAALCAAAYAASLAFVTAQQADADAALRASRQPMQDAVAALGEARKRTTADVGRATGELERAGWAYARTVRASTELDAALASLAEEVATTTGAAAALPDRISLPAPQVQVIRVSAAAPAVQAVTGGSGR